MPLYELKDWLAAAEAVEISERLNFQFDLSGFARSVDRSGQMTVTSERNKLYKKLRSLLRSDVGSQRDIDDTWAMLKKSGTSLRLLKGGG